MLRWGILGPGRAAAGAAAPAMRAAGHDLAVVGSRSRSRAQTFAANHGVRRARGSYEAVLAADDVDAVYVGLPNALHEPWTLAALEAGKHVLCERPLAVDAAGAGRMAAASARTGRVLMEAVTTRFHPRTRRLLELVGAGVVGPVRAISAVVTGRRDAGGDDRAESGHDSGALLDLGLLGVAACRWLTGEEPELATGLWQRGSSGAGTTAGALLGFPSGAAATVVASDDVVGHESLTVVGAGGVLELPRAFTAGREHEVALVHDGLAVGEWRENPYEHLVRAFAEACAGARVPCGIEDSLGTARVLDRIRRSEAALG